MTCVLIALAGVVLSGLVMAFCWFSAAVEQDIERCQVIEERGGGRRYCRECCQFVGVRALHGEYVTQIVCSECGEGVDLLVHPQ